MRRRILVMLFIAAVTIISVCALLLLGGGGQAAAHSLSGTPHIELDMIPGNGSGPCNPVDTTADVATGDWYRIAVCLTNSPSPPADFGFQITYDDALTSCSSPACSMPSGCFDSNPDVNLGSTLFSTPGLGGGFDCTSQGLNPPACDVEPVVGQGHIEAHAWCSSVFGPYTLPVGPGVSSPLAEVTLRATGVGTNNISLTGGAYSEEGDSLVACDLGGPCFGGTIRSVVGVGGSVLLPSAAVADASAKTNDDARPDVAVWLALAAAAVGTVVVGGFFVRSYRSE